MTDYVRVSAALLDDPRLARFVTGLSLFESDLRCLASSHGFATVDAAIGKLVRLWAWGLRVGGPKGDVSSRRTEEAALACGVEANNAAAFAALLRECGFISEKGVLVGWSTWTGRLLAARSLDRKRAQKKRRKQKRHADSHADGHADSLARATGDPVSLSLNINTKLNPTSGEEPEEGSAEPKADEKSSGTSTQYPATIMDMIESLFAQLEAGTQDFEKRFSSAETAATVAPSPAPLSSPEAAPRQTDSESGPTPRPKSPKPSEALPAIPESLDSPEFRDAWELFLRHRREKRCAVKPTHAGVLLRKLVAEGEPAARARLLRSVENGWQGLFFPEDRRPVKAKPKMVIGPDHEDKYADLEPKGGGR